MKTWWLTLAIYARKEKRGLALLMFLMLIGIVLAAAGPWPMKLLVDNVLQDRPLPPDLGWLNALPGGASNNGLLLWLVGSTVVLFLASRSVAVVQNYVQTGVAARMVYAVGADLFEHLQRLSLRAHAQQRTGDLVQRVTNDSGCARDLAVRVCLPVFTSTVSLLTIFLVMWQLDHYLSLLALLAAVPLPIFMRILTPRITERVYEKSRLQGLLMGHAEQTLTALPVVQAFGREEHADRTFRDLSKTVVGAHIKVLSSQLQFGTAVGVPTAIGSAAVMVVGGFHVLQGSLSVGSLLVFLTYLGSLYGPMSSLANLSSSFASAAASARRVLEILDAPPGVRDLPGAAPLPDRPPGARGVHVRLENVTFGYDLDRAILHNVSIEALPGETVALVGATGAGKSTMISLIPRFFDPWHGRVLMNDTNVRSITIASLRAQVAMVLQEPFLLPLSVAQNITYGRPDATRDEVVAAATAANAHEFIQGLPDGYDTVIGEKGATLSGGEKQRIAIARALLKNAPILILDEPTSALDSDTEGMLLEALERLIVGRTTFIIAHRLSTIRNAHRIAVIDRGAVVEVGTHRELLARRGFYHRYHNLRFGSSSVASGMTSHYSIETEA